MVSNMLSRRELEALEVLQRESKPIYWRKLTVRKLRDRGFVTLCFLPYEHCQITEAGREHLKGFPT